MSVQHLAPDDTRAWFKAGDREVLVGDVLDLATTTSLQVRFSRYGKGARHEWIVTADEALVVTRGALTVRSGDGTRTAHAGEVVALAKGARVVYEGAEDDTEVVFVNYLSWIDARRGAATWVEEIRPVAA